MRFALSVISLGFSLDWASANPFIVKDGEVRVVYRKALVEAGLPASVCKVVKESLAELLK
jgi:hypothetical protein